MKSVPTQALAEVDYLTGELPRIVPSEISRFWHQGWVRRKTCKTTEFASYFQLTNQEARDVLHAYVADGLMTFAGLVDGVESWGFSRDGRGTFESRVVRISKKSLEEAKDALAFLSEKTSVLGIVELSVGGRPVEGKANGSLLVGLKLDHRPFTQSADAEVLKATCEALTAVLNGQHFSIFLYDLLVPERLRSRIVLGGGRTWTRVHTDAEQVDMGEEEYVANMDRYLRENGHPGFEEFKVRSLHSTEAIPLMYGFYLSREAELAAFPIACKASPVLPVANTKSVLRNFASTKQCPRMMERLREDGWNYNGVPVRLMTEIDYAISQGELEEYCRAPQNDADDYFWRDRYWGVKPVDLEHIALATLQFYREWLLASRGKKESVKAKVREERPALAVPYYVAFDALNYETPRLVGFVRQPESQSKYFQELWDYWNTELAHPHLANSIGGALYKARLHAGYLSLFFRDATADEVEAFEQLAKQAGSTLKYVLVEGTKGSAYRTRKYQAAFEVHTLPPVLAEAKMDLPVLPKLMTSTEWRPRHQPPLFDVLKQLPPKQQAFAASRFVDIGTIKMSDFAAQASLKASTDPVVRASGLQERWTFSVATGGWTASIAADGWEVRLDAREKTLTLHAQIDGERFQEKLAPYSEGYSTPYRGKFSSIYAFMANLQFIADYGLDALVAESVFRPPREGASRLGWFGEVLSNLLQNNRIQPELCRDHTSWPSLRITEDRLSAR